MASNSKPCILSPHCKKDSTKWQLSNVSFPNCSQGGYLDPNTSPASFPQMVMRSCSLNPWQALAVWAKLFSLSTPVPLPSQNTISLLIFFPHFPQLSIDWLCRLFLNGISKQLNNLIHFFAQLIWPKYFCKEITSIKLESQIVNRQHKQEVTGVRVCRARLEETTASIMRQFKPTGKSQRGLGRQGHLPCDNDTAESVPPCYNNYMTAIKFTLCFIT